MSLFLLLLLVVLAGCGPPAGEVREVYLLDGVHQPDVLVESRELELPPSASGNRFVSGWWPRKTPRGRRFLPVGPTSRLEGVNLGDRRRRLALSVELPRGERSRPSRVRYSGGAARDFDLEARTRLALPEDLPLGRFHVDFEVPDGHEVMVARAGFSRALPPGEVEIEGTDVVQSGHSLVDFARPVAERSALLGRFVPPAGAASEQEFRLLIERQDGSSEEAFSWSAGGWSLFSGGREIDVRLAPGSWVRIRLLASGRGPAARWEGLRVRERRPPVEPPEPVAPPAPPRVVVLYIMDALRADHVGHLGGPAGISPVLDRLAAEGATFTRHVSVAPNTVPSMKTLFTGQVYLTKGSWKLPPDGPVTIAQRFLFAGYRTALLSGNGNVSPWRGLSRGFQHQPRSLNFDRLSRWSETQYNDNAERLHDAAIRWLDSLDAGTPAFVHIQTIHPHNPYNPPEPFLSRFTAGIDSTIDGRTRTLLDIKRQRRDVTDADKERLKGLYAGSVAYNDAELERLLDRLLERYAPEEILLLVTSDHGEELFEHDGVLHGYTLYREQLEIPLIVWWPGRIEPRRIDVPTDNVDLHHTLARLISEPDDLGQIGGDSLWPLLLGRGGIRDKEVRFAAASSLDGGIFMASSDRYKLIWAPREAGEWGMGQGRGRTRDAEYVFDIERDPAETDNLAGSSLFEVAWLRSRLDAWIELGTRLESGEPLEEMDEQTRRSLRALGYVQ